MSSHIEFINNATLTTEALGQLVTSIGDLLPKIGYALTIAAAFVPKPSDDAPGFIKGAYRFTQLAAFNVRHAENKK